MEKEFVSYEQAVSLKELGFEYEKFYNYTSPMTNLAPLKQQVFRWFRDKYNGHIHPEIVIPGVYIIRYGTWTSITYNTYEEAESACIDKFIELAKQDK